MFLQLDITKLLNPIKIVIITDNIAFSYSGIHKKLRI